MALELRVSVFFLPLLGWTVFYRVVLVFYRVL